MRKQSSAKESWGESEHENYGEREDNIHGKSRTSTQSKRPYETWDKHGQDPSGRGEERNRKDIPGQHSTHRRKDGKEGWHH